MSLAVVHSRALVGIDAIAVRVEVHIAGGLPSMSIVGLPEAAVKESKDRVRAALLNTLFEFPARRITVSLAPADLPKDGGRFDLPIALGILAASDQLPVDKLPEHEFIGELALGGELHAVRGALPSSIASAQCHRALVLPECNAEEAALADNCHVLGALHLLNVCAHLRGESLLAETRATIGRNDENIADLSDVKGQHLAKRALEVAAAGGHNLLMCGPPGTGKSMLASRLPGILPPMTPAEARDAATVASVSHGGFRPDQWGVRPFRAPHHTASGVALVGGGSSPRPGEISLAHTGVLFLDELPEFSRQVLDVLREPMESGRITISRALRQAEFPARFQLVAAMNPCPCGNRTDPKAICRCSAVQIQRYQARLSGPFLDRIDMQIEVPRVDRKALQEINPVSESSATVRKRVSAARERQNVRCGKANAELGVKEIDRFCRLEEGDAVLLDRATQRLNLSARAYHRILKLARTIADLAGLENINTACLTEAISYRSVDRSL